MKKRLVIVALSLFFLFSLLIAQYFKIQVLEEEKWSALALKQHELIIKEPFRRGTFYANTALKKGHPSSEQPLVCDVTKFHLYIDPLAIGAAHRNEVAKNLIEQAHLPEEVVKEFAKKSHSRRIGLWLEQSDKERVLKWWFPYAKKNKIASNAIYFVTDYQRSYPFGPLLGQVLHTIREIKDETTDEGLPTGGLESYFNTYLKGKQGKRKVLRSPLNYLETDQLIEAPQDGADIYLTVNHCLQAIAEEELEKGVRAAHAKGGWAVMMEAKTGAILALAQMPAFHPAQYRNYFNDARLIEQTKVKAVTDAFEMGSIMKPITLAVALKANGELALRGKPPLFQPEEKINTTRAIFPGRASKPLKDLHLHKALNMYMALQRSSNVYMAQLADRIVTQLGSEWYRKTLVETFGFETKTGIELPAEAIGVVPSPARKHHNGAPEWSLPTPYSLSIGYNLLATSLQMMRAYAVFANGGYLIEPTLVRKVIQSHADGTQTVLVDHTQPKAPKKVMEEADVREVVKAMKFTTKPGGTGRLAEVYGYTEAGKTGSAEKIVSGIYSKKTHISSFIGFAPVRFDPQANPILLLVSIDEPEAVLLENGVKGYLGGRCAAPVFRQIMQRTLEYLGVPPDDPYGYPTADPRYDAKRADWICEVKALQELYDQWNR